MPRYKIIIEYDGAPFVGWQLQEKDLSVQGAIMAAVEHLWPKPVLMYTPEESRRSAGWRFSGRWWARPVAARRDRPYF